MDVAPSTRRWCADPQARWTATSRRTEPTRSRLKGGPTTASGSLTPQLAKHWWRDRCGDASTDDVLAVVDELIAGPSYRREDVRRVLLATARPARRAGTPAHVDRWLSLLAEWAEVDSLCQNTFTSRPAPRRLAGMAFTDHRAVDRPQHQQAPSCARAADRSRPPLDRRAAGRPGVHDDRHARSRARDPGSRKRCRGCCVASSTHHRQAVERYLHDHAATLPKLAIRETAHEARHGHEVRSAPGVRQATQKQNVDVSL